MPGAGTAAAGRRGARIGAGGVDYAVWAPDHREMTVAVERAGRRRHVPLERDAEGLWTGRDAEGRAGDLYRFCLDGETVLPDPASRFQPKGVHGPSECIDPAAYAWEHAGWKRPGWRGQTAYELHVGAFTPEGTFRAAIARLEHVRALGAEAIEIMPLADFAGHRNWGYDGVAFYAPARCYGRPDDLRALVDAAHGFGLAVILDVVYNHAGPAGNYLPSYCGDYFHRDRQTPWGAGFNLDGPRSGPVREFLVGNAEYWLDEFRFDGLRLDATHAIADSSPRHLLQEIAGSAHARGAFVIAEDERNEASLAASPQSGGSGLDALWADDFHHEVRVALTGTRHAYFAAYRGTAADIADTLTHGWSYRGRPFAPWQGRLRGGPCAHLPAQAFIFCIENHDQIGNRARGERLEHLVNAAAFRAASLLLCLSPYPPLFFMGQEWAAGSPFLFFTDHAGELGRQVSTGRRREFGHGEADSAGTVPDPQSPATFEASKLRWEETGQAGHAGVLALYREALAERRRWLHGAALERAAWSVECADGVVAVRYALPEGARILAVRLAGGSSEPFEAGIARGHRVTLDSNADRFGGSASAASPRAVWLEAASGGK